MKRHLFFPLVAVGSLLAITCSVFGGDSTRRIENYEPCPRSLAEGILSQRPSDPLDYFDVCSLVKWSAHYVRSGNLDVLLDLVGPRSQFDVEDDREQMLEAFETDAFLALLNETIGEQNFACELFVVSRGPEGTRPVTVLFRSDRPEGRIRILFFFFDHLPLYGDDLDEKAGNPYGLVNPPMAREFPSERDYLRETNNYQYVTPFSDDNPGWLVQPCFD